MCKNPGPEDPALGLLTPGRGPGAILKKKKRKKFQAKPLPLTRPRGPGFLEFNKIIQLAQQARQALGSLSNPTSVDLKYNIHDIRCLANLSLYSAKKFQAAMYAIDGNQSKAREAMAESYCYWTEYTSAMDQMYIVVDLQQNQEFANWLVYDVNVLDDYKSVGGSGIPECEDILVLEKRLQN